MRSTSDIILFMENKRLYSKSFINAAGTLLYVLLVALFISNANALFGRADQNLTPVFVLLLFVVSATITGWLVLGKPLLLYLENKKKEALQLFGYTVGWLALFLIIIGIILALSATT